MDRAKERADAHYELWRIGESEASDDRIDNLLDLGYTGDEVAGRIHQDRENIRAERRFQDIEDALDAQEAEYNKYCDEERERQYQEYAESEHQKFLENKKFLEEWHYGQESPDGKDRF